MEPLKRPRVATVWLGGCSGCHMSLLDMDERLLDLATRMDLVYSPLMDIKTFPEHVDITLVEGADLTVRGDKVFLKTLTGLERVHVIRDIPPIEFFDAVVRRHDAAPIANDAVDVAGGALPRRLRHQARRESIGRIHLLQSTVAITGRAVTHRAVDLVQLFAVFE